MQNVNFRGLSRHPVNILNLMFVESSNASADQTYIKQSNQTLEFKSFKTVKLREQIKSKYRKYYLHISWKKYS